jgi:hypothetical protein
LFQGFLLPKTTFAAGESHSDIRQPCIKLTICDLLFQGFLLPRHVKCNSRFDTSSQDPLGSEFKIARRISAVRAVETCLGRCTSSSDSVGDLLGDGRQGSGK